MVEFPTCLINSTLQGQTSLLTTVKKTWEQFNSYTYQDYETIASVDWSYTSLYILQDIVIHYTMYKLIE